LGQIGSALRWNLKVSNLPWKCVWIIGASTGIGFEVAKQLGEAGVKVAASARHVDHLAIGINIRPYQLDVTDSVAVANAFTKIEVELGPVDLVLCAAGKYKPVFSQDLTLEDYRSTVDVNYMGVINVLDAVLPSFRAKRSGHIAWISSVAGYLGLPKSAAYGPTKAALINLAECLKPELEPFNITTSVINPGFVRTPMTAGNDFPMPFLMEPSEAARRTIAGLTKGKFEIAYPTRFVLILKTLKLLPYWAFFAITRRLIGPPASKP
jgi:NAD(P)-dependent dehydrogenase (short-subunit alcohol dehydrogenase family)